MTRNPAKQVSVPLVGIVHDRPRFQFATQPARRVNRLGHARPVALVFAEYSEPLSSNRGSRKALDPLNVTLPDQPALAVLSLIS